jgi:RecB family exonuclease
MRTAGEEQLRLAGMPRRLYPCTPTRLTTWLDCPRRYRFAYLDRPPPPKGPPWAHNSLGASVHTALADWWRLRPAQRSPAAAGRLLVERWIGDGYRDREESLAWRDRARAMVERYAARLDPAAEPLGIERTVATRTDRIAISGRLDRLDDREGELVVVDYKTGRHVLTTDDARGSLALAVYALAAARVMRRPCLRVELHHLPTGEVVAWEHTDESLARHLGRAEDLAAECADADAAWAARADGDTLDEVFPERPSPRCGWCDFVRHCPVGRAAAPIRAPWDALDVASVASVASGQVTGQSSSASPDQ